MSNETHKCAHQACNCVTPKNEKYCSEYCKDAKGMTTLQCHCGHASCSGSKL